MATGAGRGRGHLPGCICKAHGKREQLDPDPRGKASCLQAFRHEHVFFVLGFQTVLLVRDALHSDNRSSVIWTSPVAWQHETV